MASGRTAACGHLEQEHTTDAVYELNEKQYAVGTIDTPDGIPALWRWYGHKVGTWEILYKLW